jgi:hypothetical protein
MGQSQWFTTVEADGASGGYTLTALLPIFGDIPGGLTENRLRAAGVNYPAEVRALYTKVPEGSLGPNAKLMLATIKGMARTPPGSLAGNPYDLAVTMQNYLRDPANIAYSSDVREQQRERCGGVSSVECFAIIRSGYCEFYAGAMAIMLRAEGIPTRVAYGYLPGDRGIDGTEVVMAAAQHWWVEVFFPGYGWVEFDPTGGPAGTPLGEALPIPSGDPVTSTPGSSGFVTPNPLDETDLPNRSPGTASGNTSGGPGAGPFIVVAVLLLVAVGAIAMSARRRGPRRAMDPDHAWGALARLATRFGWGPRPAQTVFEYAGVLGEEIPAVRTDLTTVARAKVEVAYGRRELGVDRLRTVGDAYRRLRLAIVRLAIRRRRRPRRVPRFEG